MGERSSGAVVVSVCGRSHRGRVRKENQDSLLVADLARSAAGGDGAPHADLSVGPSEFSLGERGAILLVADGMGGRAGGAKASALAVSAVRESMVTAARADGGSADAFVLELGRALHHANEEIHEESRRDDNLRGMGTTATLAGIRGNVVYLAQVGDSRAYLVRQDALARITRDQSLVQDLIDSGVLTEEEAGRVRDNRILQALGTSPSVQPELTYHDLRRDDLILLCSDGLCRVVDDEEILGVVKSTSDCLAMCEKLIELANDHGGPDNITVVVARVGGEGLGQAGKDDRVARRVYQTSGA